MRSNLALTLCILVSGCISIPPTTTVDAEATEVVDGDTAMLRLDNRTEEVRFKGIDTPETNTRNTPQEFEGVPDSDSGRECLSDWGENASEYVKSRIGGEEVKLEFVDLPYLRRGEYDRLLGTIHFNGTDLNRKLVEKGYARSYGEDGPYIEEEIDAKLAVRGVWTCQGAS